MSSCQEGKTRGCPWIRGLRLQLPWKQQGDGRLRGRADSRPTHLQNKTLSQVEAGDGMKHCRVVSGGGAVPHVVGVGLID